MWNADALEQAWDDGFLKYDDANGRHRLALHQLRHARNALVTAMHLLNVDVCCRPLCGQPLVTNAPGAVPAGRGMFLHEACRDEWLKAGQPRLDAEGMFTKDF
jgi:hypothetical protein